MLSVNNISLQVSGKSIIKNFSVTVFATGVLNLYGSNGCGKTSVLRYLVGLGQINPTEILFNQKDIYPHLTEYRLMGQYVGHSLGLKEKLSVMDNIKIWADLYNTTETIIPTLRLLKLEDYIDQPVISLSMGTKKRLALSRIIITNSDIWFLDEPFANLDQEFCEIFLKLIQARCEQNGLVIMTNHEQLKYNFVTNLALSDFI